MKKYTYSVNEIYTESELQKKIDLVSLIAKENEALIHILNTFGVDSNILNNPSTKISIKIRNDKKFEELSLVKSKYYDESDCMISKTKLNQKTDKIISFSGEFFEKLDFTKENLDEFISTHNYSQNIYSDSTACICFKGVEWNLERLKVYEKTLQATGSNLTEHQKQILDSMHEASKDNKELYIVKNKRHYILYYNAPYIYDNISEQKGFTLEEIEKVLNTIAELNKMSEFSIEKDEFLLYVVSSLRHYQDNLKNRGTVPDDILLDKESIDVIANCLLQNDLINHDISFKLKIISDEPIRMLEQNQKKMLK